MKPNETSYRVLLVDDRPETLSTLREQFEHRGHRVETAEGVLQAMWAVNASRRVYDLVVSDIELSDGDAFELMTRLKERMGVRTVALGWRGLDATRGRRTAPGVDLVLPLPAGTRGNQGLCEAVCDAACGVMA